MYCPKCGAPNDDASNFCTKCSQPLQPQQGGTPQMPQWQGVAQPMAGVPAGKKKKRTLLWVVLGVLGLMVAFVIWANLEPDATPASASDEAASSVASDAAASSEASSPVAITADQAVTLVRELTLIDNLQFDHEEKIILQDDGTYQLTVNNEELANVDCFVIGPPPSEILYELDSYFFVPKESDLVLRMNFETSLLEPVTGPVLPEMEGVVVDPSITEPEASETSAEAASSSADSAGGADTGKLDAEGTLAFIKEYTGEATMVFLREEKLIKDPEGLRVDEMGDSEAADVACYLYAPDGFSSPAGYIGIYAVRVGTKRIYVASESDPGLMKELPAN